MTNEQYRRRREYMRRKQRRRAIKAAAMIAMLIILFALCVNAIIAISDAANTPDVSTAAEGTGTPTQAATNTPDREHAHTQNNATTPETAPPAAAWKPDEREVELIAKTLWGECRGVKSRAEQAAVVWCILNRVDSEFRYFPDTIEGVITKENQFTGYNPNHPVTESLADLARDVLTRWHREKAGDTNVGRTLPKEYVYFVGDGTHNYFTVEWRGTEYFEWTLPDPYTE